MEQDAERRLEERLDRGLQELKDALVRIETKLDSKAAGATVEKLEERVRNVELANTELKTRMGVYLALVALVGVPLVSFVFKKLGL